MSIEKQTMSIPSICCQILCKSSPNISEHLRGITDLECLLLRIGVAQKSMDAHKGPAVGTPQYRRLTSSVDSTAQHLCATFPFRIPAGLPYMTLCQKIIILIGTPQLKP